MTHGLHRPVIIYASELAACIGLNKYRPVEDVARKIYSRTDPEGYRKALLRNQVKDPLPIQDVIKTLRLEERVDQVVSRQDVDGETLRNDVKDFASEHAVELNAAGLQASDVESLICTERGKRSEDSSITRLEEILRVPIHDRNDKFYKCQIAYDDKNDEAKFVLGGKVDGITQHGHLVEVKNRQYRFFDDVPVYELVQIHAYMFLTGIMECHYVQSFRGQDRTSTLHFDGKFWTESINKAKNFVKGLYILIENQKAQDELLSLGKFCCNNNDELIGENDECIPYKRKNAVVLATG